MDFPELKVFSKPELADARLVVGLSGWMDGGDVSTGVVKWLVREFGAQAFAQIEPDGFYLYNFPGSMEVAALFRPHTKIEDGLITALELPRNIFYCSEADNLILFRGQEPSFRWETYVDIILDVAATFEVKMIYFVGSVAGAVPHTRDPRMFSTVSDEPLKEELSQYGIGFSNYEGPASIVTLLTRRASRKQLRMATLVAEIPAYVQGRNPRCIEAVARKLAGMLGLQVSLDELRKVSDRFERKLNEVVAEQSELSELIQKLEKDYDEELFDTQMGDLKDWLEQRGIRLD
jgi:proteasome assembly chaperone (PAC2) family protein